MIDWFLFYSIGLVNALIDENEILLITRDHNRELSHNSGISLESFLNECLDNRVDRETINYRRRDLNSIKEVYRLYNVIKKYSPDVLHIQENSDWRIYTIAALVGFQKSVLTIHDVFSHPGEGSRLQGVLVRKLRKKARAIIVHGEILKKQLALISNRLYKKAYVIPHGILDIYKKWDDHSISEEPNTILFFGRMTSYKGIDVLLKALPIIKNIIPNCKIIMAGKGRELTKYEHLLKNEDNIEIHNRFIPHYEVFSYFRRASLVVLPYTEASQSGVAAIAYAFGKPVIASDVGALSEMVINNYSGYLVQCYDHKQLADSIIKVLTEKAKTDIIRRNITSLTIGQLSWDTVADKTIKVYRQLK